MKRRLVWSLIFALCLGRLIYFCCADVPPGYVSPAAPGMYTLGTPEAQ